MPTVVPNASAARATIRSPAKEILATNVVISRARKRLSQTELAELVGISRPTVSRIERGEGDPTLDILERIATTLDISVAELFTPEGGDEFASNAELERRAAQSRKGRSVNARDLLVAIDEAAGFPVERYSKGAAPERYSNAGRPRVDR